MFKPDDESVNQKSQALLDLEAELAEQTQQHEEEMRRLTEEIAAIQKEREETNRKQAAKLAFLEFVLSLTSRWKSGAALSPEVIQGENFELVRAYFNEESDIQEIESGLYEYIARSFFRYFPEPNVDDIGYTKFYNKIKKIYDSIMLAHRFEITATAKLEDCEFTLHYGTPQAAIPEMSRSFGNFIHTRRELIMENLAQDTNNELDERKLNEILTLVNDDINHCIVSLDDENINNRSAADQVMLLAPVIRSSAKSTHSFSFSIYRNLCLIADKDHPDNPGVAVYSIPIDLPNLQEKKAAIARDIVVKMETTNLESKVMTTPMFATYMSKKLKLVKRYDIPLAPQYGSNCTWSSCAKAVLFSSLYFRLYDAAKALPRLANYAPVEQERAAHEFATRYARNVLKCWTNEDKYKAVQDYIAQLSPEERQGQEPGPIVLAFIYLKYSQRQGKERIVQLIDDAKILQPEHLKQAQRILFDNAVKKIQDEHPILFTVYKQEVTMIAEKFAELYLLGGKKVVEEVYKSVVKFSFAPLKNAVIKLDAAINRLNAAREETPKFTH